MQINVDKNTYTWLVRAEVQIGCKEFNQGICVGERFNILAHVNSHLSSRYFPYSNKAVIGPSEGGCMYSIYVPETITSFICIVFFPCNVIIMTK